jgi:hypothetical protein
MWKWFNCYLSGRHDFGVWCDSGAIFLRCVHCGKRSSGISIDAKPHITAPHKQTPAAAATSSRVIPFDRVAAR